MNILPAPPCHSMASRRPSRTGTLLRRLQKAIKAGSVVHFVTAVYSCSIWSCVRSPGSGKCRHVNGAKPRLNSPSCSTNGSSTGDGQPGLTQKNSDTPTFHPALPNLDFSLAFGKVRMNSDSSLDQWRPRHPPLTPDSPPLAPPPLYQLQYHQSQA